MSPKNFAVAITHFIHIYHSRGVWTTIFATCDIYPDLLLSEQSTISREKDVAYIIRICETFP